MYITSVRLDVKSDHLFKVFSKKFKEMQKSIKQMHLRIQDFVAYMMKWEDSVFGIIAENDFVEIWKSDGYKKLEIYIVIY
jgi:hypothetical protein